MGQNFLVDPEIVDRIIEAAAISETDSVLEIGPGLGILTDALAQHAAILVAVELDTELADYLQDIYAASDRVRIVERDARYVQPDLIGLPTEYKVVANLPYSTATVILRGLLQQHHPPASLTVMVQREVGERMSAQPPDMSLLSIATQLFAEVRLAFVVQRDAFSPPPRVESAVMRLTPRPVPPDAARLKSLFHLATLAFQSKRKTLANSLSNGLGRSKGSVESDLAQLGIDPTRRPQTLSVTEWCLLSQSPLGEQSA
jgi:16S rRNA (adenine1518-N6/adenine1519-N6)-dimethyltransferase